MSAAYDITLDSWSKLQISFDFLDASRNPVNLTGYGAQMQVRRTHESPDPALVTLSTSAGTITISGPTGRVTVTFSRATGIALCPANKDETYVYSLELVPPAEDPVRVIEGKLTVTPSATRIP